MQTIKGENYIVRYDDEKGILYGIYSSVASGDITARIYMSSLKFVRTVGIDNIQGMIFDMRRVEEFSRDNLASIQRENFNMDRKFNMNFVPTALVVDTAIQEQFARMTIGVSNGQERKCIVYSLAEAHMFFEEWHSENSAQA
jgi:hypothetical protein